MTGPILLPILLPILTAILSTSPNLVPDGGGAPSSSGAGTGAQADASPDTGDQALPPSTPPTVPPVPLPGAAPAAVQPSDPKAKGPPGLPLPITPRSVPRFQTTVFAPAPLGRSATRMPIPFREIPATVNVVSRESREMRGVDDFVGALNNVAGITPMLTYGGFDFLTIRGFQDFVILDDGIRDERHTVVQSAPMSSLVGVDRIEVLKGPASMLYGMGALGGIVNVIRRSPSPQPGYEMTSGAGSYNARRGVLGLTGPVAKDYLGNSLLYRFDAGYSSGSDFRGAPIDRTASTLAVAWTPRYEHRLTLRASYYLNHYSTDAGLPTVPDDARSPTSLRHVPADVPLSTRYNTPYDHMRFRSLDALIEYRARLGDAWTLMNRFSIVDTETEYLSAEGLSISPDTPGTVDRGYLYFQHQVKPVANQLELLGRFGESVSHVATAGYDFSYFHWFTPQALPDASPIDLRSPVETQDRPTIQPTTFRTRNQVMHGLYGQDYVTFHPRVKLLAGGRLDFWHRTTRTDRLIVGTEEERQTVAPSYRVGLVFLPIDSLVAYASYGTSFKPVAVVPLDGRQLNPELGRQAEVGVRLDSSDGRASLALAAYQINKTNVVIARPMADYNQAGEQRSRGAEVNASYAAGWVRITAGYAYTRATFLNYEADGVVFTGKRPPFVSDHALTAWSEAHLYGGLSVGGGGRLLSTSYADPANTVPMAPYVIADLALRYQRDSATVTLNIYNVVGTNPLDPQGRYFTSSINDNQLTPGPPRTALVQLKLTF